MALVPIFLMFTNDKEGSVPTFLMFTNDKDGSACLLTFYCLQMIKRALASTFLISSNKIDGSVSYLSNVYK